MSASSSVPKATEPEPISWVCAACFMDVPGAEWVREAAYTYRRDEMRSGAEPTPFRCVACGWVE